jgi:hypothetical protein
MIGFLTEYYQCGTQTTDAYIYSYQWRFETTLPPRSRLVIVEGENRWILA